MSAVQPVRWEVRPDGIEQTQFADPESFYLSIRRSTWHGEPAFIVSRMDMKGFTKNGYEVYLRHDVNAKHARHATFEDALAIATAIVDGTLPTVNYRTWREAEARRFAQTATTEETA